MVVAGKDQSGGTDAHLDQLLGDDADSGEDQEQGAGDGQDQDAGAVGDTGDTDQANDGDDQGEDGDSGDLSARDQQILDRLKSDFDDHAQRAIDRGIQAAMKRLGKSGKQQQQGNDQGDQQQSQRQDAGELREARMAYREYLSDHHPRFVDASERELANTLGTSLISQAIAEHGDPDRAAQSAAKSVSKTLSQLARAHERNTVSRLRKRGALAADETRGGGSPAPGQAPSPSRLDDKRQAASALAAEFNAENGYGQQAG